MKCRECGDEIYEYEDGLCYYCEEDEKEPEHYTGGMEPRSVFPLMDEFEAEWGVADD